MPAWVTLKTGLEFMAYARIVSETISTSVSEQRVAATVRGHGLTLLPPDGCAGRVVGSVRFAGAAAGEAGR